MQFTRPIQKATFLKRYKRFFADIEINGKTEVAHVPNTGSMKGCTDPKSTCLVSFNDDPARKLKYTLELIKTPTSWVGVNTSYPNTLVYELWEKKKVPHWKKFDCAQKGSQNLQRNTTRHGHVVQRGQSCHKKRSSCGT